MKQIVQLHEETKEKVADLENQIEEVSRKMETRFSPLFTEWDETIIIEVVRSLKGKPTTSDGILQPNYESYLEIAIETESEYFPQMYVPIWKCKDELFHQVGYITTESIAMIEQKINELVREILEEREERS